MVSTLLAMNDHIVCIVYSFYEEIFVFPKLLMYKPKIQMHITPETSRIVNSAV